MSNTPADPGAPSPPDAAPTVCVVLAAGQGRRMASDLPKPLHPVAGRSMLGHVLATVAALDPARVAVVVGVGKERVAAEARRLLPSCRLAEQAEQRGTGHAVACAEAEISEALGPGSDVFVLYGDAPLITAETLQAMAAERRRGADLVALGFEAADPARYGRLKCAPDGALEAIVEARDATTAELAIRFCNSGVMCVDGARLFHWLRQIGDDNAAGEIYLTDLVAIARAEGAVCAATAAPEAEVLGVNSRAELAAAEAAFQTRARARAMAGGATLTAPETVFFSHDTQLGRDVVVEPNVVFGPGVVVADRAQIRAHSHLEGAHVGQGAIVGPFARLRPGARIGDEVRIGNFVEVKNAALAKGAKVNHLSYIGDAIVGDGSNIGAGTITCNYDGFQKHQTTIGENVFIGSNSALVAPVTIGDGAIVAAGSTITADVPAEALALGRSRQTAKPTMATKLRAVLQSQTTDAARPKTEE